MSNYIGAKVTHKKFGTGSISEFDGVYVKVNFNGDIKKFAYPAAFESFLTFEDEKMQEIAVKSNEVIKDEIAKEKAKKIKEAENKLEAIKNAKVKGNRAKKIYEGVRVSNLKQGDGFDRIVDAINACLGRGYSGFQQAFVKLDEEYAMWFPKMAIIEGNAYVAQAEESGWINTMDENGNYIYETNSDLVKLSETDEYKHMKRLVFAKFDGGPYVFMGIYKRDPNADSSFKGRKYIRIATETNIRWS